ncbi:MAG: ferredoxin [Chromatiales bacterium]|jgi:2Fe-2S ferredoxin|nr:MAG: ferredoxin [Chromatiales bacterium]
MAKVVVTDRDGVAHEIEAETNSPLMYSLRDLDYGVEAICGGVCSCATCHVFVDDAWIARLPARDQDEEELLEELEHFKPNSRLSCQIEFGPELDGLKVTIAPEE